MKSITFLLLSALVFLQANGQRLPNVQQIGVKLPANVKIDGKATEWNDQMQAYNTTSDISYTMANNNELLYLVIQAKDVNIINTIFGYGFELAIHRGGRKDEKDKIAVTYPLNPNQWANTFRKTDVSGDTAVSAATERMNTNNSKITKLKKLIVSGIPGMDTISVYNDAGILAACQFDIKGVYTVEMAIPLKLLGLKRDSESTFTYHMALTGYVAPKITTVMDMQGNKLPMTPEAEQGIAELNARIYARNPRTDFWGEYTLAK